jgi:oligopeptide transport system substrate-binding protein
MGSNRLLVLSLAMLAVAVAFGGCSSGGDEPISTATSIATVDEELAAGADTGLFTYFSGSQGFLIAYPKDWTETEFPLPGPVVAITGPRGAPRVSVFVGFEQDDSPLRDRQEIMVGEYRQALPGSQVVREEQVTLEGDLAAIQTDLQYTQQALQYVTRLQMVTRGTQSYLVVATAPIASFQRYEESIQQTLLSFALFVPSPEGVPPERALFLAGADPITLDPAMSREIGSHLYVTQLFSGLVRTDQNLRVQPELAETWSVENSTVYTFTLRAGIIFQDGREITAEDFKYSIERAADPALRSPTARTYLGDIVGVLDKLDGQALEVSGVEVLDLRTLRITIDGPKAYFLSKLTYPTAAVVDRATVESAGLDWWRQPNGSGPFKLSHWDEGEVLVLERHQGYLPVPSKLEFAVFRILSGIPIRMYEEGTVDVAQVFGADVDRALDPDNQFLEELTIFPQFMVAYLGFNTLEPPFDDPLVRRAFAMSIDRQRMMEVVYQNTVELAVGILPPGMPGYNPDLTGILFDPGEARRLVQQSSYGSVEALPPVVFTTAGLGTLSNGVAYLLENWRVNLGVEVEVNQLPFDTYSYQLAEQLDNLYDTGWVADYPDPQNFLDILFHSGSMDNNPGGYANQEVDRLLEEARTEPSVDLRLELYQQVEQLILDDAAAVSLYHARDYMLIQPYVNGYVISPLGTPVLADVEMGQR